MSKQTLIELVKDSPLPVVTGLTLWGLSLNEWVLLVTLVVGVLRLASAALDLYEKWKAKYGSK